MKKMLLGAVGLSAALASCGGFTVTFSNFVPSTEPSPTLRLASVTSYATNHELSEDVKDQNGNTIAKGTDVICDNRNTQMDVGLTWTGGLSKLYVQFKGLRTGETENANFFPFTTVDRSGSGTASYNFGPGTAPQSIGTQAIIVNPVKVVEVKGSTYVRLQGLDENNRYSNVIESVTAIPVVECS